MGINETIPSFEYCDSADLKAGDWYVQEAGRFDLARRYSGWEDLMATTLGHTINLFYADGNFPNSPKVYKITDLDYIALLELKQ